ncbi:MAG: class I SAM-dependent methyltransferase [Lachnospiraceae bacterium]|nr:class I SAM-dependent methyltransferase [Lachnospiraceae bacterium]
MTSYDSFADVYDELMDNVPYQLWADQYAEILRSYGIEDGLVCDLACGSGNMTMELARRGFDMIGIDDSEAMLNRAREKSKENAGGTDSADDVGGGNSILYLLQDMCEFELYGTVRAVTCACDSINYLLTEEEVLACFKLVNNYLDPGGIFLFDFNTAEKYAGQIGDSCIAENREGCSFIWENEYDEESGINTCELTLFVRRGHLFERNIETHLQRGYEPEEMKELIIQAGLEFIGFYPIMQADGQAEAGRLLAVARECGKQPAEENS